MSKWFICALVAVVSLAVTSCDNDTPPAKDPARAVVTVTLRDAVPLSVLFNGDGQECTSNFLGQNPTPVEVALRNADGTIVGTETLPVRGGTFAAGTCTWPVTFKVERSTFYEVTVTSEAGAKTATGQASGGTAQVEIDF